MSIAAKLQTIAENVSKVYEQGMADSPAHAENELLRSIVGRSISGEFVTPAGIIFGNMSLAGSLITKLTVTSDCKLGQSGYSFARMSNLIEADYYYNNYLLGASFAWCSKLETLRVHGKGYKSIGNDFTVYCTELKNFLFVDGATLKLSNNGSSVTTNTKLTVESLLNILNACEDNTGGTTYTLKLGSTNLAKLTEEQKQIAYDKNIELI